MTFGKKFVEDSLCGLVQVVIDLLCVGWAFSLVLTPKKLLTLLDHGEDETHSRKVVLVKNGIEFRRKPEFLQTLLVIHHYEHERVVMSDFVKF